jgi:predicted transcriptional regulator with HTH domain
MLRQILDMIEREPNSLYLEEIAYRLDKAPSAVEGMLDTLVCMGKLVEVNQTTLCEICQLRSVCIASPPASRTYALASLRPAG